MPPKARAASRSSQPRPLLTLVILFVVMALGTGLMFLRDATSPRLGLDLAGGTSVTLLPRVEGGGSVSGSQLNQAIEIIRNRVNGLGVSEADVQTQGSNIVVSVPGATNCQALELISSTAQMRFRAVLQQETAAPSAPAAPGPAASATPAPDATSSVSPPAATAPATVPTPTAQGRAAIPDSQTEPSAPAVPPTDATTPNPTPTVTPTPSPSASDECGDATAPPVAAPSPSATPSPTPAIPELLDDDPAATDGEPSIDAALAVQPSEATLARYASLDCTLPANLQGGGDAPANEPIATCNREGTEKYLLSATLIEGTHISGASSGVLPTTNENVVSLSFDGSGGSRFGDVTTLLYNNGRSGTSPAQFAVVLDNLVVEAAGVNNGPIFGGRAQITGNFTQKSAQDLAQVLKYGALPVSFDQGEVLTVSATVGQDQLDKGLLAGGIGLALVVLYSLLFYRGLGIVSILSLAVAGAMTYIVISLMGDAISFALILAGVIGVIVSIGITADSFVVYFERIRDEIRDGRPIRVAVEKAWPRARRTILVADAVTFLAALVLYFLSIGRVQNFAFTLGLTTLIDVVVVFYFTKPFVTLLVKRPFFRDGHVWSGLNPERAGAKPRRAGIKGRLAAADPGTGMSTSEDDQ